MKKKLISLLLATSLALTPSLSAADELMDITHAAGYTDVQEINRPKASILIDGETGDVLWEDNADTVRDPASMSKAMSLYLVFEALAQGRLTEDTVITATPTDQAIAGIYEISNNKIVAGVDYTVSELITMTAVPSSNVTTLMLANYLSDNDPDKWLDMMNEKAQELGMTNTKWYNASGAAAIAFKGYYTPQRYDNRLANQTTARDLSIMTYNFVKNYPKILDYTSKPVVTVKAGTPYEETFETYNYSIPGTKYGIEGVDGLKTGSSPEGAFNYIATAKRGDQRVISVIMGVGDWSDQDGEYYRHPFGNALIEKMYKDYEYKKVLDKGEQEIDGKKYTVDQDVYATVKKDSQPKISVENGDIKVDNGLSSVSPKITQTAVKATEVRGLFNFGDNTSQTTQTQEENVQVANQLPFYYWFLWLIPVGILYLIYLNEKGRRQKVRERRQQREKQS